MKLLKTSIQNNKDYTLIDFKLYILKNGGHKIVCKRCSHCIFARSVPFTSNPSLHHPSSSPIGLLHTLASCESPIVCCREHSITHKYSATSPERRRQFHSPTASILLELSRCTLPRSTGMGGRTLYPYNLAGYTVQRAHHTMCPT